MPKTTSLGRVLTGRHGPRPILGAAIGLAGVVAINTIFLILDPKVTRTIPLLLLLVPVTVASVVGGWRASVPLALVTGLAYSFHYIAPINAIRLGFTEDTLSMGTFVAVAIFISELGRRRDASRATRERQRSVLLRTVSHDLRNPLGTIRAASAELRSDVITDPDTRNRLLDLVVAESERLDRIIRNLLSLSRVEAGALDPDLAPEALGDIVGGSVRRLRPLIGVDGGANVIIEIPDDLPDVLVDHVQIDQVVTNLIENAQRHAVGSTDITVRASLRTDGMVSVSVIDAGPGFSPAARATAFAFFEPSGVTGAEGIGLAVCRAIVEAHGGTIAVDDAPDGGAGVTFSIPTAD